ncbi:MAG: hypothetical protein HONBIEJF_02643 [Fimbriimonadaceae bacterium]|nr:hypothetical protein [Fimbriimonadaceae bacterium]
MAVLVLALIPIYMVFKRQSEKHLCQQNMVSISKAIQLYAASWSDRLPPIYSTIAEGDTTPTLDENGRPYTWVSLVQPGMSPRASFRCPSATDAELVRNQHSDSRSKSLSSAYGMYVSMATRQLSLIPSINQSVLISETSNFGAESSYDPMPFVDPGGNAVPVDGFLIGYDDSNLRHTMKTQFVTRLAYRNSAKGVFSKANDSRHPNGIHYLFVDGHVETLGPSTARVARIGDELSGIWSTR